MVTSPGLSLSLDSRRGGGAVCLGGLGPAAFGTALAEMEVEPHIVERLLNHSMGAIGNQADSIVSAVAEVYILAKYMPKMRDAIKNKWEPFLQDLTRAA